MGRARDRVWAPGCNIERDVVGGLGPSPVTAAGARRVNSITY